MISWKSLLLATRPKTLTASVIPVFVGSALAKHVLGAIQWQISFYALLTAIAIQVGTNLINDAYDFKKGADTRSRIGPIRVTQAGLLSEFQVLFAGFLFFTAALLFSLPLMFVGGLPIIIVICLSILCGVLYTAGPIPLAYLGFGEIFVMLFFGLVATISVFLLQGGKLIGAPFVAGAQVGFLAVGLIAVNNLRDVISDAAAKKLTLAVRFGQCFGKGVITFSLIAPFFLNLFWIAPCFLAAILPFFTFPLASFIVLQVWKYQPGRIYNKILCQTALLHMCFGTLLALGFFIGYTQTTSRFGFWQRERSRDSTIVSDPILKIWGSLRSLNPGSFSKPKSQILKLFVYKLGRK